MSPRWFHFLFLICCWLQDIQPLVCWPVICLWLLNGNITDYKWNHASSRRAFIQLVSNWVCAFTNKQKNFFLIHYIMHKCKKTSRSMNEKVIFQYNSYDQKLFSMESLPWHVLILVLLNPPGFSWSMLFFLF